MSWVAKGIGIVIIALGFLALAHTTMTYNTLIKQMGTGVLTSSEGGKIWEHWAIEAGVIMLGIGILALGIKLGRRSD